MRYIVKRFLKVSILLLRIPIEPAGISNLSLCMLYGLPGFVQQAAYTALTDPQALASSEHMRVTYQRRRDRLVSCFQQHQNLSCITPQASMFLLVNVSETGLTAQAFAESLFEQQKIGVLPATAFGECAADFIRISYVVEDSELEDACERIDRFMALLNANKQRA